MNVKFFYWSNLELISSSSALCKFMHDLSCIAAIIKATTVLTILNNRCLLLHIYWTSSYSYNNPMFYFDRCALMSTLEKDDRSITRLYCRPYDEISLYILLKQQCTNGACLLGETSRDWPALMIISSEVLPNIYVYVCIKTYIILVLSKATHDITCLTLWGRVTHICVGNLTNIGSDNGLSPGRRQATI